MAVEHGGPDSGPPVAFGRVLVPFYVAHVGGIALTGLLSRRRGAPPMFKKIFIAAIAVHVAEAVAVNRWGKRRALPRRGAWTMQTLAVGYPSLLKLRAARRA
jgi:hypothetical protein